MQEADILIIGAGASGLMAALELTRNQKHLIILEASGRIGGRIYTTQLTGISTPVEAGAEFIHGQLPETFSLIKQASLTTTKTAGDWMQLYHGKTASASASFRFLQEVADKIKTLNADTSIDDLLTMHFNGEEYKTGNEATRKYIQGYDAADPAKASAFAFLEEWENAEEEQFRITGGYGAMIRWMTNQIPRFPEICKTGQPVKTIEWQQGKVTAITEDGQVFQSPKAIITVPLGIWQAPPGTQGHIQYTPALPQKTMAASQLGFGGVIKILLAFRQDFWTDVFKQLGFIMTDAFFQTWWTQLPEKNNLLTGWIGGPAAAALKDWPEDSLVSKAIQDITYIFKMPGHQVKELLLQAKVFNWTAMPYISGAYAYKTVQAENAIRSLMQPEKQTLYFAGEALYSGYTAGTVEAALCSGKRAAFEVLQNL